MWLRAILCISIGIGVLPKDVEEQADSLWSEESECWLKQRGACFKNVDDAAPCPLPGSRTWFKGCPEGYTCCIPPKELTTRKEVEGGCGYPPLMKGTTSNRIVGGFKVKPGQLPWQALIREISFSGNSNSPFCGGSIIDEKWVLSAAHCFQYYHTSHPSLIRVDSGATDISDGGKDVKIQEHEVEKIINHERYNKSTGDFDIALLKLKKPITFDDYRLKVCLPRPEENFENVICTVSGWGYYNNLKKNPSSYLRALNIPIVSWNQCNTTHQEKDILNLIHKNNLCTLFPSGGRDSCEGDSGGPLACLMSNNQWLLAGVVSWGDADGCALKNLPGVYIKVSRMLDWIHAKTKIPIPKP